MQHEFSMLTSQCHIRDVRLSDDEQILAAMSCPKVAAMYSGGFQNEADVQRYIDVLLKEYESGTFRTLAVAERQSDRLIGCITIDTHKHFPRAELSYWLAQNFRNRGYMTEAITAVIQYGFSDLELRRIQAYYSVDNPASGRVLEKTGMVHEGTLRLYNGISDAEMYAVIHTD